MKRINEVWWVPVSKQGDLVWHLKSNDFESIRMLLDAQRPGWKADGWRIAKVAVKEAK